MTDPTTALHYTANGNFVNGVYAPGADGFNLADVSSVSELNALPPGVKGLVYLGLTNGADANFQATVSAFKNNPNLYGFYIADEPGGGLAANLKAEADWIHANVPGAKTFIVEQNLGSDSNPDFVYNPANTDIDLFGLDPYPIKPSGVDYSVITTAVSAAEAAGIPLADIVPVYQAFGGGGYSEWTLPTPAQETEILSTWGGSVPNPVFDYAYSWGVQDGDTALSEVPGLQAIFAAHNAGSSSPPPPPPPPPAAPITSPASGSTDTTTAEPVILGGGVTGDTVTVFIDGTQVGTAPVSNSAWTFTPTSPLSNANHTVTATQAAAGGPSSAVATDTFTVNVAPPPPPPPPPPPVAPTLTIADTSLTVTKHGGTVALGISETAPSGATDVTAKITGLPSYETIKDKLDGKTFSGSSITLSEAEVDSGLTLTSNYRGSGHPVATLTVTGSDLVGGVAATSAPQSIKVTDPGPSWSNDVANLLGGGAVGFNQPTESHDYLRVASATIAEPHRG